MAGRDLSAELFQDQPKAGRDLSSELFADYEKPTWVESVLAKTPKGLSTLLDKIATPARSYAMGAADPSVGAAQLVANLPGINSLLTPNQGLSDLVTGNRPQNIVNQAIAKKEAQYQGSRGPDAGFDWMRLGGNITSPVNLLGAKVAPTAATTLGRVGVGSTTGAIGAASQPLTDTSNGFWGQKAGQTAIGAVTGGTLTPILGKIGDKVAARLASNPEITAARASLATDKAISDALKEVGQSIDDLPKQQLDSLRLQVNNAFQNGKQLDAAAILRKADFNQLGIQPTLGQITRDATQFATEKNLRGVANVGEPLQARFSQQGQQLTGLVGNLSNGADEAYGAGNKIIGSLQAADNRVKAGVDSLYSKARDNLGRAAPMDSYAFHQQVANDLAEGGLEGSLLPEARKIVNDIASGAMPFNVNTAVQVDRTLSAMQRGASLRGDQITALSKVRDALNSAPIADNVGADAKAAFDAARAAARQRFQGIDSTPALKAAINGAEPDNFVNKYIINGNANQIKNMVSVLDADAHGQAKAQIGKYLEQAAFGQNAAGDKVFQQESFNKAVARLGTEKLSAFFSPAEIEQIKRIGRVGAYMVSPPSEAPVNYSNTAAALKSLNAHMPSVHPAITAAKSAIGLIRNPLTVRAAMNADIPASSIPVPAEIRGLLAPYLAGAGLVGGGLLGSTMR